MWLVFPCCQSMLPSVRASSIEQVILQLDAQVLGNHRRQAFWNVAFVLHLVQLIARDLRCMPESADNQTHLTIHCSHENINQRFRNLDDPHP